MKKILKIVLTVAFVAGSTSVFAQKLGRINMQELVFAMPETAEMQKNLEAYQKELQDQLETIGVEFNNKLNEYTKQVSDKNSTMSDSVRQLKEKELNDLKTRYDEFVQVSQQDMQKKQGELLEPIIVKAQDAVKEVSKAGLGLLRCFLGQLHGPLYAVAKTGAFRQDHLHSGAPPTCCPPKA